MKSVNFLNLQHVMKVYPLVLKKVLKCCYSLHQLRVLDVVEENNFDAMHTLIKELKNFKNLLDLNFEKCFIGSTGAAALAEELKCCIGLEVLNLHDNKLYSAGTLAVAGGLKYCRNLKVFNMSFNMFSSPECIAELAAGLEHMVCLEELYLSWNDLSSKAGEVINMNFCIQLQILDLGNCSIDFIGAVSLAEKLIYCSSLQHLILDKNNMGGGIVAVANALRCPKLQVLQLSSINMSLDGVLAISNALKRCPDLQTLDLSDNNIDNDGMEALADGLKCCKRLEYLRLRWNNIGSEGAASLSKNLKDNTSLQELDLEDCQINSSSVFELVNGLKHCQNLLSLNFSYNKIDTDGAIALAEELKFCYRPVINLTMNPIEVSCNTELYQQLSKANILI